MDNDVILSSDTKEIHIKWHKGNTYISFSFGTETVEQVGWKSICP